jgi:hypothetical protein
MDKKEFRARLEQVAVLKDRKPIKSASHRSAIEYITEVDELGEEYQVPVVITENPTLGFELVRLKDQNRLCELGCEKTVPNQIIERRLVTTPVKHWRTRCKTCDCYVAPDGVGLIKGSHLVQNAYVNHFKGISRPNKYKQEPETPDGLPRVIDYNEYTETITNDMIIRKYK